MTQQVPWNEAQAATNAGEAVSVADASADHLVLDESERCIRGLVMTPLLGGEFKLLSYLGARSPTWHSSYELSVHVYHREDAAGRQLVWKYASTLRRKLVLAHPALIELCRRRGYRCRQHIVTVAGEQGSSCGARLTHP
jgi:DNA-binding response OmpR family regulator